MITKLQNLPIRYQALLLLMVLFSLYGVFDHFFDGILPIHEWRKTDSLSIALNYAKGAPFLEPQTQLILANGTRNATSEFPIIYFILENYGRYLVITSGCLKPFRFLFFLLRFLFLVRSWNFFSNKNGKPFSSSF